MKIERTKNAARNIVFGGMLKIYQILVPFLMRTAMIYFLGVEYLGLSSLFVSILQVLNLAELGVGSAMVFSMYKPIVEDDRETICALMALYRKYYRIIGAVVACLGIALLPFVPKLIKGTVPEDINVYILYILQLGSTVLSYWLFAYKNCLLNAHQRNDVISKVTMASNTIQYLMQLFVLCRLKNFYLYMIVALVSQILNNITTAYIVEKMYPDYKPSGVMDKSLVKDINTRIRDLFTAKFSTVVVGAADTVVISAFLGLTSLAIYQNYYYIMNSVCMIINIVFLGVAAGIGNSLITEKIEKNYRDFEKFTFIISWIIIICSCCFIGLYQPFMKIWVGDDLMLSNGMVVLFCVYFYVSEMSMVWATVKDAAGLWHADRFRPLAGAVFNLLVNILLVNYIGLYGIVLSTILSYVLITMPWMLHNLFSLLYKKMPLWDYCKKLFGYILLTAIASAATYFLCDIVAIGGFLGLAVRMAICLVVSNVLFVAVYRKHTLFKESMMILKKMLRR